MPRPVPSRAAWLRVAAASYAVLVAAAPGRAQTETIGGRVTDPGSGEGLSAVALAPGVETLDDVVVGTYGETSRANAAGSVTRTDERGIAELPVAGLDQAIAGRSPSAQGLQSSGIPGGGPETTVRGLGTVGGANGPLLVVDGVPVGHAGPNLNNPLNSIPPDDVQSITVLRDAASTALYGSRASGGGVLVTTKQGRAGRPQVSFGDALAPVPATRESVRAERRIERAFENVRWFDLVRWGIAEPTMRAHGEAQKAEKGVQPTGAVGPSAYTDVRTLLAVPAGQVMTYGYRQNPGW